MLFRNAKALTVIKIASTPSVADDRSPYMYVCQIGIIGLGAVPKLRVLLLSKNIPMPLHARLTAVSGSAIARLECAR